MADTEIADAPKAELASNLTLDILQTVKVSQSQHGLRHGDHARYRCAAREKEGKTVSIYFRR
jgi:hypothetical protein